MTIGTPISNRHQLTSAELIAIFLSLFVVQFVIITQPWGVVGLVVYFCLLVFLFQPQQLMHPNIFVLGYYFLWMVCPAMVDLFFHLVDWQFVLPWGRLWDWSDLSTYTLVQIQISLTVLVMTTHYALGPNIANRVFDTMHDCKPFFMALKSTRILNLFIWVLIAVFVQASGGLQAWFTNYGETYLTGRAGLGVINVTIITLSAFSILIAGLRNFGKGGGMLGILTVLPLILAVAFIGGFKSRLLVLLIFFFMPYLLTTRVNLGRLLKYTVLFFGLLYVLTLWRSDGFYSGAARFLELIPSYFNAYPLHDIIVERQDPSVFQTLHHVFVKPAQIFGFASADADFDVSIMLTKEYFPDHWYLHSATQQWPLETDMYLNAYGIVGQPVFMACYAFYISWLFRLTFLRRKWRFYPIVALELVRIISTLRGVLIPWNLPILIMQYSVLYVLGSIYFSRFKRGFF